VGVGSGGGTECVTLFDELTVVRLFLLVWPLG
jgi:hypothetical protein